jgi:transcriptional regulator with XRE-family HTH domain
MLGGILRSRRNQLSLSMREVARRVGIVPSYLHALERGRNPSTGGVPVPSPPILSGLARVLDVDIATLLDACAAPASRSVHLLLYQTGPGHQSPVDAARRLFTGHVDAWIEIVDPRRSEDPASENDVLIRKRGPLGSLAAGSRVFESSRLLAELSDVIGEAQPIIAGRRLGMIFGANSALLRTIENPPALLESEATWERDVAAECRAGLGVEANANVCVYRQNDLDELAGRLDPLAAVLRLIDTHPHVAVQEPGGHLTTGPAATELILAAARPPGVSAGTWESLARVAAVGLMRNAASIHPPAAGDA